MRKYDLPPTTTPDARDTRRLSFVLRNFQLCGRMPKGWDCITDRAGVDAAIAEVCAPPNAAPSRTPTDHD